jgi:TRAP-type C4-dicarboxylate transport system substrate-binding protein
MKSALRVALVALGLAAAAAPAEAQIPLKMTGPTIRDSLHVWMDTYKERLEKRVPGKFKMEVYPASQLGSIPRMIEGMQLGTIEMALIPPDFLVGVDKRFQVLGAPMVIDDQEHGYRAVHHPDYVKTFWSVGEAKGIKIVGQVCDSDAVYVFRRPLKSLDEFKGRKIRVFGSQMEREGLRLLGATPAPMPPDEVLPALQQGVLDGAKSGVPLLMGFKYYTTVKHLVRVAESHICVLRLMSKPWFDKVPRDLQGVLLEEAKATDAVNQKYASEQLEALYKGWVENGGDYYVLTAAQRNELEKLLRPVGDDVVKNDPELREALAVWKRVADATRKK